MTIDLEDYILNLLDNCSKEDDDFLKTLYHKTHEIYMKCTISEEQLQLNHCLVRITSKAIKLSK